MLWISIGFIIGVFVGVIFYVLCVMQARSNEENACMKKIREPRETMYHKYPVLILPTESGTDLVMGVPKARAALRYLSHIVDFVKKHDTGRCKTEYDHSMWEVRV